MRPYHRGSSTVPRHRTLAEPGTTRVWRGRFHPFAEQVEARVLLSNILVTNTNDSGTGSLRDAISIAQATDQIVFNIPMSGNDYNPATGSWTIALASPLPPVISASVVIDGLTQQSQPGASTTHPVIEITPGASFPGDGLTLLANNDTVRGLVISGFQGAGIVVNGPDATAELITGNFVGTDVTGTLAVPNQGGGIHLIFSSNNTIGGTTASDPQRDFGQRWAAVFRSIGVLRAGLPSNSNFILGNYIGVDADGQLALGNSGAGCDQLRNLQPDRRHRSRPG